MAGILKPFAIAFTTTYPTQEIIRNGWVPLKAREVVAHAQLFLRHRSLKHQLPRRKGIIRLRESQNRTLLTAQWILKRQESYSENNLVTIKGVKVDGCISTGSFRRNMVPWQNGNTLTMPEKASVLMIRTTSMDTSLHTSPSMLVTTLKGWCKRPLRSLYRLYSMPALRTSDSTKKVSWRAAVIGMKTQPVTTWATKSIMLSLYGATKYRKTRTAELLVTGAFRTHGERVGAWMARWNSTSSAKTMACATSTDSVSGLSILTSIVWKTDSIKTLNNFIS